MTLSAPGYVAGTQLVVECSVVYPAGSQVQSLLWTPSLPAGWALVLGSAVGDGGPEVDPDGLSVVFNDADLSQFHPLVFRYRVAVPAGEYGARSLGGTLDFQLVGMANPAPVSSGVCVLTDAAAAHGAIGYLAGTPMTVTCTFSRPAGVVLQSLLWRPELPAGWTLPSGRAAVSGDGDPEVDPEGEAIILSGDLTASVLTFTYTVNVPADARGVKAIGGGAEYQLQGMANPVTARAAPDPLAVRPMHTLQIVSAHGQGDPAAGVYTNFYGAALTNRVSVSDTVGGSTYGCAGWLLAGNEPVSGAGTECRFTLTNNASLAWVWVAPSVGARTVDELQTLAFQAGVAYSDPAFPPLSLSYSLDAASLARGMSITSGGAFSWTPTEEQGGTAYSVTVTVTDDGLEPHWLSASETFTVTVAEVNRAPVLGALSDRLADAASTLAFTATAADPDEPDQALTFSLDAASLALGMAIDPSSGVFTWSPTVEQAGVAGQSYTVQVTVTDSGTNPANLSDTQSFSVAVADSRGAHATAGYLQGRTAKIDCTFEHPASKELLSLLWRPVLPAGWELLSVEGQAEPELDRTDGTIVFAGAGLNAPNPLTFSYRVSVPAGVTGPQFLRAQAEYQTVGMANPVTVPVNPDPLLVPELHTFEVVSAEGHCVPAVGVYTNVHGAALSASVSAPVTAGARTFACTGWTLAGLEPAAGPGDSLSTTLTRDAVLTWNWVSPLIAPAAEVSVTMDEDNAPAAWVQPALTASEPYRPELVSGLAWSLLTPPVNGAAAVTGTGAAPAISYAPAANWYGSDSFVVQVADGLGGFDRATVNVTVNPVNDAPVLDTIGDKRTDEFTPLAFTVSASDLDVPAQGLSYTMTGAPAGATLDPVSGAFAWTPAPGQAGADLRTFEVTFTVTDDGARPDALSDSETLTITLDSSRAEHSVAGYVAGQPVTLECVFRYPAAGRQLQTLLWRPELPAGWTLLGVSGQGDPQWEPSDAAIVFQGGDLPTHNPVAFRFVVLAPADATGLYSIGGAVEYQLDGMANPAAVRAQPDRLVMPMLLTLPELVAADKVYDGQTNATVVSFGSLAGVAAGHDDVALVSSGAVAFFETPAAGSNKAVRVSGLALSGSDAAWYAISTQRVTAAITPAVLTVGGGFTAQDKTYDGTAAASVSINNLTLVTPVGSDDVTLQVVAAFDDKEVGAGKVVRLVGGTLGGAARDNYTLSLEGAPTAAADILFPAVAATHETSGGYQSPSVGKTVVSNSFEYPEGAALTALSWKPALLPGWSVHSVSGDGEPVTDGATITFQNTAGAARPLRFAYTLLVPGGAPGTNYLNASVTFSLSGMADTLDTSALTHCLPLKKFHSADYQTSLARQTPNWAIDSFEITRFFKLWRSSAGYHVAPVTGATPDGFDVGAGPTPWFHSADYQSSPSVQVPDGKINTTELNRVLKLWRTHAGAYHPAATTALTPDGYDTGVQ